LEAAMIDFRRGTWQVVAGAAIALLGWSGCGDTGPSAAGDGQGSAGTGPTGAAGVDGGSGVAGSTAMAGTGTGGAAGESGSAGTGGGSGGGAAGSAGSGGAGSGASSDALRLTVTARDVPGGGEDHVCVTLALPNTQALWVKSVHATLTTGSHHLIVDRHPAGTPLQTEPLPCPPTMGGNATRLLIAQQPDTVLDLPEGTAMRIEPQQPVFLQLHYFNLGTAPADVEGMVELIPYDGDEEPVEAQSMFTGSFEISLPAGSSRTVEHYFVPPGTPSVPVHVYALTSHTHALGVDTTIERVAGQGAPDTTPLHQNLDWHEPPLTRFDPALIFDGRDGLRLRCRYLNDTGRNVRFGTRFEDEMCFMWVYYYEPR
jgi:hypothetical protein